MKRALSVALVTLMFVSLGFTADPPQTVSGWLIDNACARQAMAKGKQASEVGPAHDKFCLKECADTGFAVLTPDNKVIKLDKAGNEQATKLIDATNKTADWKVHVTGTVTGDEIAVRKLSLDQ